MLARTTSKNLMKAIQSLVPLALVLSLAACNKADHDHDPAAEGGGHTHEPRIEGNALVELGDHEANLEVGYVAADGALTVYLLDAHAQDSVFSKVATMDVTIEPEGKDAFQVTLAHVASALSKETVGNSSVYSLKDPRLVDMDHWHGTVKSVVMPFATYTDVSISWPPGDHDHDEDHADDHDEDHAPKK